MPSFFFQKSVIEWKDQTEHLASKDEKQDQELQDTVNFLLWKGLSPKQYFSTAAGLRYVDFSGWGILELKSTNPNYFEKHGLKGSFFQSSLLKRILRPDVMGWATSKSN